MTGSDSPTLLRRFSSRHGRLSHVFLKDRLRQALEYRRIAGYFRSSIFELVGEEIAGVGRVQIVCNSELDARDIKTSRLAREMALKEKWNEGIDPIESLLHRSRYRQLYDLLKGGKVEVRVVSAADSPFLHGKAGVIVQRDGSSSAFLGGVNETREGWQEHYEVVWEDSSAGGCCPGSRRNSATCGSAACRSPTRSSRKSAAAPARREVGLDELDPADVAAAALVEAPLYRHGEQLMPWQRAFVGSSWNTGRDSGAPGSSLPMRSASARPSRWPQALSSLVCLEMAPS